MLPITIITKLKIVLEIVQLTIKYKPIASKGGKYWREQKKC